MTIVQYLLSRFQKVKFQYNKGRNINNNKYISGEKMELEMTEGREKLVEDGEEDKTKANGAALQNGRLLAHDKDSGKQYISFL